MLIAASSRPDHRRSRAIAVAVATALAASSALLPVVAHADPPPSPGPLAQGDVIYQVLVDRFHDGDSSNNDDGDGEYDPTDLGFYHGGDWAGLTQKLGYIADLGVTAVWISPVSEQQPLSRDGNEASYHGYFTRDYATPNDHFGSSAELQTLLDTAHGLGLKMILDVVPNHTADYLAGTATSYSPASYAPAAPLDDPAYFHHHGDCLFDGSESQAQIEECDLGGLDDLDQSNPAVSTYLTDTYKDWVDLGFDGIRVDAARSIPRSWLAGFESAMGDLFDQDYKYANPNQLETFIDNHDRARFLTWADDNYQRLRSALSFLMTTRGVPVIYYGTEQADDGNGNASEVPIANKDNRKDMTSFDENAPIYRHLQRLASVRKSSPALRLGVQREMWSDASVYGFSRRVDSTGAEAITLSSNSWSSQTRTIPLRAESSIAVGATLTNAMNTAQTVTVASGGVTGKQITVTLGEHDTAVYLPGTLSPYTPAARNTTTIRVHYDVGFGHSVAIRGDSYPFTWTSGRGAHNVAPDVWEFELERIPDGTTFQFKPLIDDAVYSVGANYTGTGGDTIDVYPTF